jgi:DNA-binding MarR family transcriptional regulator
VKHEPVRSPRTQAQFKAFVAVVRAAEIMQRGVTELLKKAHLTTAQYNVLRVLRGAGDAGLACGEVGERLIRHDPDVTRLVDRLARRGLVVRTRERTDRRVVRTRITTGGLELLSSLDGPIDGLHEQQLGNMSESQLSELASLLERTQAGDEK